ncbi:MAG TPA: cell surface protein SprA, partial [Longimicrobiales bacterium]|nr:cell surface protein SprA [Longimicrobiales bacterium]
MRYCVSGLLILCSLLAGPSLHAQQRPAVGIALDPTPLELPAFRIAPLDALFVTKPFATWLDEWTSATRALLAREERERLLSNRTASRQELADIHAAAAAVARLEAAEIAPLAAADSLPALADSLAAQRDSLRFLPPLPEPRRRTGEPDILSGVIGDRADLGVQIRGMANMGGAWSRVSPCDPSVQFTCKPGMFPELRPDIEFGIRAGGTVSDRVHVDIDYDQAREFDAANNINVYYQGLQDEVLQRVEFGDVSIRLPASSYLTRGVPAGNFGLMAAAQVGPLEVQTVFAQQKGDVSTKEFRLGTGGQAGVEQDAEIVIDDADYVQGQFFFLVPPSDLAQAPHIDVLGLQGADAPASVRPGVGAGIQLYRDERLGGQSAGQPGYFLAEATPPTGAERHTGTFRRLVQEQDYFIHASGLWIMLRSPLRADEALAVSFVTETGDTVGYMNAESAPAGVTPRLRLLRGPVATHQPGSGTWEMELHQVYRLDSSSGVDLNQVELTISLGAVAGGQTFRDVAGGRIPLLRFFGLDEESPADRIDEAQIFQPARDGFGSSTGTSIGGTYIVFPTLRPFAEPGPVPSEQLSAAEVALELGVDANDAIYEEVDPVNRAASSRFQLNLKYRVKVDGVVSSFSLGAFGLREDSERLFLGNRRLERGVDYNIDYEIGTVSLTDPQALFATSPGADLRATWEQKPLFSIAPTSVFGTAARYAVGTRGELNFVGLYQAEQSLMSRPQLGVEPGTAFLGGMSGRFDLGGALLDRALGGMRSTRASGVSLTGEVAFSMPNPNREGQAYLDDFESADEVALGLRRQDWKLGSAPQTTQGDDGMLPFVMDATTAAPLVWQHDFFQDGAVRGALMASTQIDRGINVFGTDRPEQVMWLTFGRGPGQSPLPPPTDDRRWRSMTTLLSTTGRDMSRSEYLEFYVSAGEQEPLALIFDIGTVGEDAFYVDSLGNTNGVYEDGRTWGLGELDEEARLIDREVWGTDRDRIGLWNQECIAEPNVVYPFGDPRSNCTRGNGRQDTEDLNGNGILDADDGQYFRYVVRLDEASEYLVRDTAATGTVFRLYRIPLRTGEPVNGAGDATWRFIRHLRMTIAGEPQTTRVMSVARMRIVGSRWTKRDVHGVRRGLLEDEAGLGAGITEVRVGPVSAVTDGAAYRPPPGVGERAQDPNQQFDRNGIEINEKSLRLAYTDLDAGDRAEVYYRYPQQPRNLLTYRELRLWVVPREGSWGPDGGERFTVRIGSDPRNFYLYQSKLTPATGDRPVTATDWMPEIVIDFQQWFTLKAEAEQLLIERGPSPTGVDTVWSADSTYAIVLQDRARAPNLAAVRELVFAVYNGGAVPTSGEVWINDMRIGIPDREMGAAGNIALNMNAGDFVSANVTLSNQGPLFRQLNENPSYVSGSSLSFGADARLDRLLPARWGLDVPLSVTHTQTAQTPTFLSQTDVQADRLQGLREAGSGATRVGLRISKRTPSANPFVSILLDGSALRLAYTTSDNRSITSTAEASGFTGDYTYRRDLAPRTFTAVPGIIESVLRAIAPERVENSAMFSRLVGSQFRWSPAAISFGSSYNEQMSRSYRFDRILALPGDTSVNAIESPREGLRNDAQLTLRPFAPLSLSLGVASVRDLLDAERSSTRPLELDALNRARSSLGGMDVGWERSRNLNGTLTYRPEITSWLRAEYTYSSRYDTDRNPSYLELTAEGADTTAEMQRRFEGQRQIARRFTLQLPGLAVAMGLDSMGVASRLLRRIEIVDLNWRSTLSSQFERESFLPGFGYQLGFGSLDSYTYMGADTASRAQQRGEFRAASGLRIIGSLRLDMSYHDADTEVFDARGGSRLQREVGWPKASLQWRPQQVHERFGGFITSFSTTAGIERIERTTDYTGQANQLRGATELRFPFSISVGLPRAFLATYRGSYSTGETLDPTGGAESGGLQQDLALSATIPAGPLAGRLDGPISTTLTFSQQGQRQCRYTMIAEAEGCIAFLDFGTRSANLFVESRIREITVGMQGNYVARQNQVGTRNTSSQF